MSSSLKIVLLAGAGLQLLLPALAFAQSAPATGGDTISIADIIVTAQRRNESLSKTPVAVAILSADQLVKNNVRTETDLVYSTPGLSIRSGASSNEINFSLRGQSVDAFTGTRPGVLPYFNEVQISDRSGGGAGATSFYDLQSLQVLKGPQGTLFGRNATGGAVLFTTAKPTNEFEGYVSARYGNYDTKQLEGAINIPVVDNTVLARVAGFYGDQTGFQRNTYYGTRPGSSERYGLRGSLTVLGGTGFRNELVVDYYHADGSNVLSVLSAVDTTQPIASKSSFFYSPNVDAVFGPGTWAGYLARRNNPSIPAGGLIPFLAIQKARGPFVVSSDALNVYQAKNITVSNQTVVDLGENTQLKNIFGYAHIKTYFSGDSDGSPYGIASSGRLGDGRRPGKDAQTEIFSEELQLQGKAIDGNLNYTAGLYLSDEKSQVRIQSTFFDLFRDLGLAKLSINSDISYSTSYAAYAQGTYQLGGGFGITAGLRYTTEKVRAVTLPEDGNYATPAQEASGIRKNDQTKKIDNLSWTFGVQNQVDSNLLLYAVTRRSYRNGGFNPSSPPIVGGAEVNGNSYKTETVTDAEIGSKYAGSLGNVPVRLNLALYQMWIKDAQRNAFVDINGPASLAVNVPRTKVYGLELDGQFTLSDWLNVGGNINYTHARFTNPVTPVFGGTSILKTVPDTPEWSGVFFVQGAVPLSGDLALAYRGDVYAQKGTYYISSGNLNPTARLPGYALANFRLGVENDKAGWSLTANLKNAFNRVYYVGGLPLASLLQTNTRVPGAPRTYSVEARFKF